jgi:hypothetical protein
VHSDNTMPLHRPPSAHAHHRAWLIVLALPLLGGTARAADVLPAEVAGHVEREVRQFMLAVAADVTQQGPTAWQAHFSQAPSFFMAVNGQLQFASGAAAESAIAQLPKSIQHIALKWGDDLRVDPLTAIYAVVASSYSEKLVSPDGATRYDRGYFSAVVELDGGHWRFRDAHWSSLPAAPH